MLFASMCMVDVGLDVIMVVQSNAARLEKNKQIEKSII